MKIMNAILEVNYNQPLQTVKILESEVGKLSDNSILLLGLSFKPDTDDVRNSPSLKITDALLKKGAKIYAHDPIAIKNFKSFFGKKSKKISFVKNWKDVVKKVKIIIIISPWNEYFSLSKMKISNKVIFDVRCAFSKEKFRNVNYLTI